MVNVTTSYGTVIQRVTVT